jgi:PAS domain S-box-containing protein/TyrR family helix-turn-helix protein
MIRVDEDCCLHKSNQKDKIGFIKIDDQNRIIEINEAAEGIFREKVEGCFREKSIMELMPDFKTCCFDGEENQKITIQETDYLLCCFRLCDGENSFRGILMKDMKEDPFLISEFKEQDAELDWVEILEGSFDGILVTDADGKILYVNSSYERVAEIKRSDMEGKTMRDLINPVWMPNSVAYVVAEQKTTVSKRQVVKSGRHIMVTGRPIFDAKGEIKLIVINARDITEIYDLSEELQKARQVEKMYMDHFSDISSVIKKEVPILAVSKAMKDTLQLAEKVAGFQTTVLIIGDSGVGKEEVAKYIHQMSMRKDGPFIAVNCGAIPDNLLESELFGYEKGAFTGALQTGKTGLIEAAQGGTIFLDEIGETSLDFQVKLLRFLETKEIRRIGNVANKTIDVRVIAATNRDLKLLMEEGKFREDLFYRMNVVQITVPPLSARREDIMPLAAFFLQNANQKYNQEKWLTYDVVKELENKSWEGNVRELKNVIENMVIVSNNEYLQVEDLPWYKEELMQRKGHRGNEVSLWEELSLQEAMDDYERELLLKLKETCSTTREMAERLKVNQSTVVRKLQKYGIVLN